MNHKLQATLCHIPAVSLSESCWGSLHEGCLAPLHLGMSTEGGCGGTTSHRYLRTE